MKKFIILTFTFSIMLLCGVSCSMMDEPDMPVNNNESIDNTVTPTEDVIYNDFNLTDFKIKADSIFKSDPYFASDTIFDSSDIKKINKKVDIITTYHGNGCMTLEIPVTHGVIFYVAESGTIGIPTSRVHFIPEDNEPNDEDFSVKIASDHVQITGKVSIYHTFLGINYTTTTIGYVIYVNHPWADVYETVIKK